MVVGSFATQSDTGQILLSKYALFVLRGKAWKAPIPCFSISGSANFVIMDSLNRRLLYCFPVCEDQRESENDDASSRRKKMVKGGLEDGNLWGKCWI